MEEEEEEDDGLVVSFTLGVVCWMLYVGFSCSMMFLLMGKHNVVVILVNINT